MPAELDRQNFLRGTTRRGRPVWCPQVQRFWYVGGRGESFATRGVGLDLCAARGGGRAPRPDEFAYLVEVEGFYVYAWEGGQWTWRFERGTRN